MGRAAGALGSPSAGKSLARFSWSGSAWLLRWCFFSISVGGRCRPKEKNGAPRFSWRAVFILTCSLLAGLAVVGMIARGDSGGFGHVRTGFGLAVIFVALAVIDLGRGVDPDLARAVHRPAPSPPVSLRPWWAQARRPSSPSRVPELLRELPLSSRLPVQARVPPSSPQVPRRRTRSEPLCGHCRRPICWARRNRCRPCKGRSIRRAHQPGPAPRQTPPTEKRRQW